MIYTFTLLFTIIFFVFLFFDFLRTCLLLLFVCSINLLDHVFIYLLIYPRIYLFICYSIN